MSNVLLAIIGWDPKGWDQRFRIKGPQHKIRMWPEYSGDPAAIDYACVWNAPHGALAAFPNLKAIFSLGAGLDELVSDPDLPKVPVVRIVDPDLTMRMTEYVVLHVLMHHPASAFTTNSSACGCGATVRSHWRARYRSA